MHVVLPLLPAALALALSYARPPEVLLAALAAVAALWMPGRGFARALRHDPIERALLGFWLSCGIAAAGVLFGALSGTGPLGALAVCALATAVGHALPAPRPAAVAPGPRLGWLAVLAAVALSAWSWRATVTRPLEAHWWHDAVEEGGFGGTRPDDVIAFGRQRVGEALRLVPRKPTASLLGPMDGTVLLAFQGPVGATLRLDGRTLLIEAAPTVSADEGPVPRYTERGVTAALLDRTLAAGERLDLVFSDPHTSAVWLFPTPDAVWDAHGAGRLRFVHYYQLLNMEEQVRWARELFADRRVTDVQPPLGAYVAAIPLGLTGGGLPAQNVVFVLVLCVCGLSAVACLRAWAPEAPITAWLLPAAAVAVHARLLFEPGSTGMPDSLYAAALVLAFAGLAAPRGSTYGWGALLAQLARYPGAPVAFVAGLIAGQPARASRMLTGVLVVAAGFGVYGVVSGQLQGWIETVAWETGPEHWHGNHDLDVLLPRAPRFFLLWLGYAGAAPLLALLRWSPGTRVLLGTAVAYALLLCTVDHTPSHYFVPLVHLSIVALGCSSAELRGPRTRLVLPLLGLLGLGASLAAFPVTG